MLEVQLTPHDLEVLLHYFYSPAPFPRQSECHDETVRRFMDSGIMALRHKPSPYGSQYELTSLGLAWVHAILSTPIPTPVFRVQAREQTIEHGDWARG